MPKTKQEIATVTPITAAPSPLSLKLGDALFSVLSVSADWSGDYRAQFELYGLNVKAIKSAVGTAVWHAGKGRFLSVLNGSLTEFDKGDGMKLLEDSCGKFWHRTDAFIARLTDLKIKTDDKVTKACIDMARAVRQAVASSCCAVRWQSFASTWTCSPRILASNWWVKL